MSTKGSSGELSERESKSGGAQWPDHILLEFIIWKLLLKASIKTLMGEVLR